MDLEKSEGIPMEFREYIKVVTEFPIIIRQPESHMDNTNPIIKRSSSKKLENQRTNYHWSLTTKGNHKANVKGKVLILWSKSLDSLMHGS